MSNVRIGIEGQEVVKRILEQHNFIAEMQKYNAPFDILVNGKIRVDVKTTTVEWKPPSLKSKNKFWRFMVRNGDKRKDCDFYIFHIVPENVVFVVPSDKILKTSRTLAFVYPLPEHSRKQSEWQQYENRFDLLSESM